MVNDAIEAIDNGAFENPLQEQLIRNMAAFPYKWDVTGKCEKLGENGKCTVYSLRPFICNIKRIYKHLFSKVTTWKQFVRTNASSCQKYRKIAALKAKC
jgi:Fe-S-cluster containining protein